MWRQKFYLYETGHEGDPLQSQHPAPSLGEDSLSASQHLLTFAPSKDSYSLSLALLPSSLPLLNIYMLVDSENQKFAIYIFSVAAVLGLAHQEKALISWTHLTPTIPSDASPYSANKGTPSLCPQIQLLTNWFIWAKKSFLLVEKSCSIPKSPSSFSSVVIVSSWVHLPSLYKDRHSETNFQFF